MLATAILGRTGLVVTRMAIGGGYNATPGAFRAVLDAGVTHIDTARSYSDGNDERRIGEAITGRRGEVTIATKSIERDDDGAMAELETSLRELGTDYVDIWNMHGVTADDLDPIMGPEGSLEAARRAKEGGKTRFIGITSHEFDTMAKALETDAFDAALLWYNPAFREPEEIVFPIAERHNVGIFIMNATRWGRLLEPRKGAPPPPDKAALYRFALSHRAVHCVVSRLEDPDEFIERLPAADPFEPLSETDLTALRRYGDSRRALGGLDNA